jgi:Ca2+-binding RTX toxin-like protein
MSGNKANVSQVKADFCEVWLICLALVGHDTFVGSGIFHVWGSAFADTLFGNNGTFNQFEGLAGDDSITGNGNTRLIYTNATGGVAINLQAGSATGDVSVGHDTFVGVNSFGQ